MKSSAVLVNLLKKEEKMECDYHVLVLNSVPNIGEFERGRARASASEQLARSLALKFWLRSLARQKSSNSQLARSRSLATFFREVQLAARSLI